MDLSGVIAGVIAGTLSGIGSNYVSQRIAERHQRKQARSGRQGEFDGLASSMPDLIRVIKEVLSTEEGRFAREFVPLHNPREVFGAGDKKRFLLYQEQLSDLFEQVAILEDHGFIEDMMEGDAPAYRMSEEFVAMVKACER